MESRPLESGSPPHFGMSDKLEAEREKFLGSDDQRSERPARACKTLPPRIVVSGKRNRNQSRHK
jgi:hypothetical protein